MFKLPLEGKITNIGVIRLLKSVWIEEVPSYANKFIYSLGFLSIICFMLLLISGILLVFFGTDWWFTTQAGVYTRSIHLWAVQAFVVFVILHALIVIFSGAYRSPRKFAWVIGSLMFFLALMEAEFGYVLRDDFSSQWRSLQGADLYNGSGLGRFINNLNYAQIYGIHIIIIPIIILLLLFLHYGFVKLRGIAKPYRADFSYQMVMANHTKLFLRGSALVVVIFILAFIFPSPIIAPITIKQIALDDPGLVAKTILSEINHSSDTATYSDNINPYQFDTEKVYVQIPYNQYASSGETTINLYNSFNSQAQKMQDDNLKAASDYFDNKGALNLNPKVSNPLIPMVSSLVLMAQSGLYEASLKSEVDTGYNPTYTLRFLSDTGVLEDKATNLNITTPQYGMLREAKGKLPPGAWWLAPLGLLDNTLLANDDNQDQHGAMILGTLMLLFMAFPYIPGLNSLPDKLGLYKIIWRDKKLAAESQTKI